MSYNREKIVICPARFYFDNFSILKKIAEHHFGSAEGIVLLDEIEPSEFLPFKLDWVLAKIVDGEVVDFCVVEVQSIDTSGTVRPVYDAFLRGNDTNLKVNYSPNWANVFKRLMPQVISKGSMCLNLGKPLYVVIQDRVLQYALKRMPIEPKQNPRYANIIFVPLSLTDTVQSEGFLSMETGDYLYTTSEDVQKSFVRATYVSEQQMIAAIVERQRKRKEEAVKATRRKERVLPERQPTGRGKAKPSRKS